MYSRTMNNYKHDKQHRRNDKVTKDPRQFDKNVY